MSVLTKLTAASYQADLTARIRNALRSITGSGAPVDGTDGAGYAGPGSEYIDIVTGFSYYNVGTKAAPIWLQREAGQTRVVSGTISSAFITGTSAGQLGHANGYEMVAAAGAHIVNDWISTILINDFGVAAYTGGGNTTINIGGGGAALSGLVSNANFIQAAADKIIKFVPLAATFLTITENTGINLVTASAPTNPGTAVGVFRFITLYRQVATGL